MAQKGLSALLDVEVAAAQQGSTNDLGRGESAYPQHVAGEPIVGRTSHPWGVAQAGFRDLTGHGFEIHEAASRAALAELAHIPTKPYTLPCGRRFLCRPDSRPGYPGVPEVDHNPHVIGPMAPHIVLPWIHRVFSNLKTWALGVYHGLHAKHLQAYLDEFVFCYNRRRSRHAAFRRLLGLSFIINPATYNMLITLEAKE
jgi:hypothetical protein